MHSPIMLPEIPIFVGWEQFQRKLHSPTFQSAPVDISYKDGTILYFLQGDDKLNIPKFMLSTVCGKT